MTRPTRVNGLAGAVQWLPAVCALAYVATVASLFRGLVHAFYWDSDVAAPVVLAARLRGHGPVYIPHFSSWTATWWVLATRDLPGHVQLWEATGYVFALAGAGLLGWATARIAGRWAGVTAAAAALVVGPTALRSRLGLTYHTVPPFTAAVLGAYLVLLARSRSRALAAAVGLVAGLNAASDPLVWPAAVVPFALGAGILAWATRRTAIAVQAGITLAVTVASAVTANAVMHSLGFNVIGLVLQRSNLADLGSNIHHLGRMIALLGGANYARPPGYPSEPLRFLLAVLALIAVAAALFAAIRAIARRFEPTARAYACYWASAIVLLCLGFVGTTNAAVLGAGSMNYLLTLPLAAGAGVAVLAASSRRGRLVLVVAITLVGAVNIAGLVEGRTGTPRLAIVKYGRPMASFLEQKGVTRGYAGYWDAGSMAWKSGMRVSVAPVAWCHRPPKLRLCEYRFFTIGSWFSEHPGPSFLIVDPETGFITRPPPVTRDASASYRFGPLTVYVFPYDLARHISSS